MRMRTAGVFVVGALLSIVACGDDDGGPSDNLDIEKPTLPNRTVTLEPRIMPRASTLGEVWRRD